MFGPHTHTGRQSTFPDNVCSYWPPVTVCYTMKIWLLFCFSEKKNSIPRAKWRRGMKKRIRERVTKSKGAELSRMMRVGNLWVIRLRPRVRSQLWSKNNNLEFHSLDKTFVLFWGAYHGVSTALEVLLNLTHHIPDPTLPTINLVDKRSLLIRSCW
jgi:hypothetical protein